MISMLITTIDACAAVTVSSIQSDSIPFSLSPIFLELGAT